MKLKPRTIQEYINSLAPYDDEVNRELVEVALATFQAGLPERKFLKNALKVIEDLKGKEK